MGKQRGPTLVFTHLANATVKILGVPIKIEASFLVLVLFLAGTRSLRFSLLIEWLLIVFFSILLHELGHALTGRKFGLSPSITLYSMGGLTSWTNTVELPPFKHLLISLAGPAAGFLFGGILLLLGQAFDFEQSPLLSVAYRDLFWVNIGWGVFNLLPMLPLDGGQVLVALESHVWNRKDQILSHAISLLIAVTIAHLAISRGALWITILGVWFAFTNGTFLWQKLQAYRDRSLRCNLQEVRSEIDREQLSRRNPEHAREEVSSNQFEIAITRLKNIEARARTLALRREAAQLFIFLLILQRKHEEAGEELSKFEALFGKDDYLRGLHYYETGKISEAIPYLRVAFNHSPSSQLGLLLYNALIKEKEYSEAFALAQHSTLADVQWELFVNLQTEAFNNRDFAMSAKAGVVAYEIRPDPPNPNLAYNIACAFACASTFDGASNPQEALKWLAHAIETGFKDTDMLKSDADLQAVRSNPEFDLLLAKLGV